MIEEPLLNIPASATTIPAAWLRPLPEGYKIPIWKWILLPAGAVMLHHSRGVWVSGDLSLRTDDICFSATRMLKSANAAAAEWNIRLADISNVTMKKGVASETIEIYHSGGIAKMMSARSADFVAALNRAASEARQGLGNQTDEA
jgi:hypothetical protein